MTTENNQEKEKKNTDPQVNTTDPQENEKDGNVFGTAFDKLTGNSTGGNSMSEEESREPGKQESIKDGGE